jgi:hypothetical protein
MAGAISSDQLEALLAFLATRQPGPPMSAPKFDVVHLLWYMGALVVISAMGLFSTLAFSKMGGPALTATALVYAALFTGAGHYLWSVRKLRTPGGLLIAVAVSMIPLAVYGVQDTYGAWSQFGKPGTVRDFYVWIKGSWIFMELATIAGAMIALRFYRFPFIVFIMAVALWFLSMDIVPWITGSPIGNWESSRRVSVGFGLGIIIAAIIVNVRQRSGDFAFWLYLFGVMTFWGGVIRRHRHRQGAVLRDECRLPAGRCMSGAPRLRDLRNHRYCDLSRRPRRQGFQGFDDVPVRPVPDRHRHHRARAVLSPPSGHHQRLGGAAFAGTAQAAAARECGELTNATRGAVFRSPWIKRTGPLIFYTLRALAP